MDRIRSTDNVTRLMPPEREKAVSQVKKIPPDEDNQREKESLRGEEILATSKDGDTASATSYGQKASGVGGAVVKITKDGAVTQKESEEENTRKITNLTGLTEQQVEKLYREGKISRYTYEKDQKEREEEKKENAVNKEDSDSSKTGITEEKKRGEKLPEEKENREELLEKEKETNAKISENMKDYLQKNNEVTVKNEAFENALENDNMDVFDAVFASNN